VKKEVGATMAEHSINATVREVLGKDVKKMRREGKIPAVIYGPKVETPVSITLNERDLGKLLAGAGADKDIELTVDGKAYTVRAHVVERHITRNDLMHVDFLTV
jgi:large subunit ribosomal protein L25